MNFFSTRLLFSLQDYGPCVSTKYLLIAFVSPGWLQPPPLLLPQLLLWACSAAEPWASSQHSWLHWHFTHCMAPQGPSEILNLCSSASGIWSLSICISHALSSNPYRNGTNRYSVWSWVWVWNACSYKSLGRWKESLSGKRLRLNPAFPCW